MEQFWEKRYSQGGTSGVGSVGEIRAWKWKVIDDLVGQLFNVVDVGCGDLSFWENRNCQNYVGIDVSQTVIEKDKDLRPNWKFICSPADVTQEVEADVVLCMDVLFHILDEEKFRRILGNLAKYSKHWIVVSTWYENPFIKNRTGVLKTLLRNGWVLNSLRFIFSDWTTDFVYEKYRVFEAYFDILEKAGFKLVYKVRHPPANGLYIFSNKEEPQFLAHNK